MENTIYVISTGDDNYLTESLENTFGCGGLFSGTQTVVKYTKSLFQAKHFYSESEALLYLKSDFFKDCWRWSPNHSYLYKEYYIIKMDITFSETITKTVNFNKK